MTITPSSHYLSPRDCKEYNDADIEGYGPKYYPGWFYQEGTTGELIGPFKDEENAIWDEQQAHQSWAAGVVGGMLS